MDLMMYGIILAVIVILAVAQLLWVQSDNHHRKGERL